MSQFPNPYGYGQYHGQHPPQPPLPPHPYGYPNVTGYAGPAYNSQYNSSAAMLNHDVAQASFQYNAAHIPGLGITGAAPGGSKYNPAAGPTTWPQHQVFPLPAQASAPGSSSGQHSQNTPPGLTVNNPSKSNSANPPTQTAPMTTLPATNTDIEEGELSEGQFEDLYEPRESVPNPVGQTVPKLLPIADRSQPTSAADTPEGGFYGTDEDDGEKASRGTEGRERSASYSPFLSPREIQGDIPMPQPAAGKGGIRPKPGHAIANRAVPNLQPSARPPANTSTGNASTQPGMSFRSLHEAKKEAQKAILRLWPLGVKYQTYIDEGFDEKLVRGLFGDLHLDMPKTDLPASQPEKMPSRQSNACIPNNSGQPSDRPQQQPVPVSKDTPSKPDQSAKGEERKDRIARLLAAKKTKTPAALMPTPAATQAKRNVAEVQLKVTKPAPAPPTGPKTKAWGEKERLLQQKIAALQKSRETQHPKSATDLAGSGLAQVGSNGTPASLPTKPPSPAAALSIPTGPRASVPGASTIIQPSPSQPRPSIPGLVLPLSAQPHPSGQRKRPVASDFVEYSSGSGAAKRPFGQARKEDSLIIDVSDVSDDEEMDMDMDMESPGDGPSPIQSSSTPGQHGLSIRDFPPLTDNFTQRQFSSPVPSPAPPNGPTNNRRPATELNRKEKAIQDMRRKIALAEAKRSAKQSSGGLVTPRQAGQTPEPKESEVLRRPPTERAGSTSSQDRPDTPYSDMAPETTSAMLPKPSEAVRLDQRQRAGRRGRIVSLDLPQVESSLEEKLSRLNQLRDEQARLQAEIDRSFAEKRKLNDELEQLETTSSVESPQPNGLDSGDSSVCASQRKGISVDAQKRVDSSTPSTPKVRETDDVSMGEAGASPERSQGESHAGESIESEQSAASSILDLGVAQTNRIDNLVEAETQGDDTALANTVSVNDSPEPQQSIESSARDEAPKQVNAAMASTLMPESINPTKPDMALSSMPDQVDATRADETAPMELDSSSPSPEATVPVSSIDADDETNESRQPSASGPDQISSVAQPREEVQEIETETAGEMHGQPASKSASSLMPYESPLRFFHAYRFHPDYPSAVAGGLKSLTYSNRINTEKELCPYELNGEQCAADCEFQHFSAISPPDDQILLELGNPDDYSGEEKSRFIQGLRELLHRFKADKVRDFDTIARAIIDFRSQLLGDNSKVLRLDGVTI